MKNKGFYMTSLYNESMDPLKGVVECYENGNLKWCRNNKITYMGRSMMLKALVNSHDMNISFTKKYTLSNISAKLCRNSFVNCFAVGSGGNINDAVIPNCTSFSDLCLNHIEPFASISNSKFAADDDTSKSYIYATEDQLTAQTGGVAMDMSNSAYNANFIYFKRVDEIGSVDQMNISRSVTGSSGKTIAAQYFNSYVTLTLSIDGSMFTENKNISELGLYMGSLYINDPNSSVPISTNTTPQATENTEGTSYKNYYDRDNCYPQKFTVGSKEFYAGKFVPDTIPVLFSHLAFPQEYFDINSSKTLTFKYTLYV